MLAADSLKKIVRSENLPEGRDQKYFREKSHNLFFFCTAILKSAWEDKFNNFGRLQKAMCAFLDPGMNKNRRLFMSVFRGSYKSTILLGLCLSLFCWSVATGEPVSIVYNTATKDNAELFMAFFRRTLVECDLLYWIFPELPAKGRTDLYRSFTQTMVEYKNAVFHVSSIETQQTGRHYTCILPGIYVHTSNGIEKIEDIKLHTRVLCGDGTHTEVLAKKESIHSGKIIETQVWGQPETIKSTPEHRFLTWGESGLLWKEAEKIKPGEYLASPLPSGLTRAYSRTNQRLNKILERPDFWRFIGYWLAEGCASAGNRIRLTFSYKERNYCDDVKEIIEKITGKPVHVHSTKSSTLMVDFADADVKEILSKFGTHSYNKHLPAFVLSCNPNRQRELILGYFRGDGHNVEQRWSAASVSRSLIEGIKTILASNGIESVVSIGNKNFKIANIVGNLVKARPSWTISTSSPLMNIIMGTPAKIQEKPAMTILIPGFILNRVKKVNSRFYSGPVYDLQVKKTESFSVMGGLAHNCIINDDLVTKDNAFSEVGRSAVRRAWSFQKAILTKHKRLGIGTEIDVGTLYHENDLIAYLINEARGYDKFIVPYSVRTASGREVLSFPEMFTWEDFEDRLSDMGETDFSTQYKLLIHGGSNCLIRREKLKYWNVLPLNYTRYMFIDPAGTEKEKNDPWGFLVWDLDERGYLHVRYCEEAWHDIRNGLRHADHLSQLWNPDEIWFEKEKYSIAADAVSADIVPHLVFQLHDHKNEPPDSRVRRLKPYLETGKILFGEGQEALLKQVLRFPDVKPHDDLLMCMAHAIRVGQAPKKGPAKESSKPAEKDFHEEMAEAYKRMSRIRGGSDQEMMDSQF